LPCNPCQQFYHQQWKEAEKPQIAFAVDPALPAFGNYALGVRKWSNGHNARHALRFDVPRYEDYVEAFANWTVDRRVCTAGKQVIANAAPGPERFQIAIGSHTRADTFLLDTETGKVWSGVREGTSEGSRRNR
jgi:hypothetical protein